MNQPTSPDKSDDLQNRISLNVHRISQSVFDLLAQGEINDFIFNRTQKLLDQVQGFCVEYTRTHQKVYLSLSDYETRILQDEQKVFGEFLHSLEKHPKGKALREEMQGIFKSDEVIRHYMMKYFYEIMYGEFQGKETYKPCMICTPSSYTRNSPMYPTGYYPIISPLDDLLYEDLDDMLTKLQPILYIVIQSLSYIRLEENKFQCLLGHLKTVRSLSLEIAGIDLLTRHQLKQTFQSLPRLKILSIHCLDGSILQDPAFVEVIPYFCELTGMSLAYLDLNDCNPENAFKLFSNLRNIHTLCLREMKIERVDLLVVEKVFGQLQSLRSLDLKRMTFLGWESERKKAFFGCFEHVKHIDFYGCYLGKLSDGDLTDIFSNLSGLTSIDLGVNTITPHQATLILSHCPKVKSQGEDLAYLTKIDTSKLQKKVSSRSFFKK